MAPLLVVEAAAQANAATTVKNVVLVHGAWADGSSWSKLIPLLQAKSKIIALRNARNLSFVTIEWY